MNNEGMTLMLLEVRDNKDDKQVNIGVMGRSKQGKR